MLRVFANRGMWVRTLGVLAVALVCVIGTLQVTHAHSENSATSHHPCSICATVHAGLSAQTAVLTPTLATTEFTGILAEVAVISRPVTTHFIRPPPAL